MKDLGVEYNYGGLTLGDILEKLRGPLSTGQLALDTNTGKVRPRVPRSADWDSPWYHVKHHPVARCGVWNRIMFEHFHFVPTGCMGCWKVVVRPRYLEDLFKLLEIQLELDRPSKCGTELRATVYGPYGGYFYNRSKEEGQECYKIVVKKCKEYNLKYQIGFGGKPVLPLLKRGCTEMEMEIGPSDEWKQTPEEKALENILSNHVEMESYQQPMLSKPHIVRQWIDQAYSLGDPTVWQFNDGKPFYKSYVTYHKEIKDA